jgi:hypothetical protein
MVKERPKQKRYAFQEEETKVGLEDGKPKILRRRSHKRDETTEITKVEQKIDVDSRVFESSPFWCI